MYLHIYGERFGADYVNPDDFDGMTHDELKKLHTGPHAPHVFAPQTIVVTDIIFVHYWTAGSIDVMCRDVWQAQALVNELGADLMDGDKLVQIPINLDGYVHIRDWTGNPLAYRYFCDYSVDAIHPNLQATYIR